MPKTIQVKPEEQAAREYADRLILSQIAKHHAVVKLSEIADQLQGDGIGLASVRALLASNPEKFAYVDRRWVPASRVEALGRPLAEQIRVIAERFGGPMPLELLISEVQTTRPATDAETIERIINASDILMITPAQNAVYIDWVFQASDETVDRAFAVNGITDSEVEAAQKKLGSHNWREPDATLDAIKKIAPVSSKVLGALAWLSLNPQDPHSFLLYDWKKVYRTVFDLSDYVLSADGVIHSATEAKKWIANAVKLAEKIAPTIELEDAAPIEVKSDDISKMVAQIKASESSITATRLLEQYYEITPSVKTFVDDLNNVMDALKANSGVLWLGADRFNKPGIVPELVEDVPGIFHYEPTNFTDEEGERVDIELSDEGLSTTLRKLLNHPLAMDVLDESETPKPKQEAESIRCVLKSIHREVGTFPLCQIPTGWIAEDPKLQELVITDPEGREIQVWVNNSARLMFGFIDWFYEQEVESGAVFSLTKTAKENVLEFAWLDQTDPVVFITKQRMEELRELQGRCESMSTYDILREVMSHWPKGADFLTLLWEVNVVRRSSRRLVASLLSSYACFYQRSGSPVWHYDQKKVDLGFDKTKKKFIIHN